MSELAEHAGFLRRLALRLVRDEHLAQDLVQDTLLVAVENPTANRGPLRRWLTGVLKNLARMSRRAEIRRIRREELAARREILAGPGDAAASLEASRRLVEEVSALAESYRCVIVLRYFHDLPPVEIARRLGVPGETVRTRLRRALALLRGRLDARHDGDRKSWVLALLPLTGEIAMKKSIAGIAALSFFLLLAGTLVVIAIVGSGGSFEPPPLPDVAEVGTSGVADTPEPAAEADPVSLGEVAENAADPAYPPDRIARVRVVDPEGRPLSGVRVELLLEMKTLGDDAHAKVGAEAVSDEAGRVDFDVDPLTRYQLRASHPDFAIVGDVNCFGGNVTALCLPKGGRIAGTVTDAETGKPLPGADVYAMDWSNVGIVAEWRATTDEEGRYRIEGVGPGALNMNARAPDRPVTYPTKGVRVTAGEETVVDFALPLGRRVALRVVNAESGVAIPEVTLEHGERADIVGSGERIETWPLPPDGSALRVAAEGFVPLTLYLMDPGQEKEAFREVRLSQASVVTGIVRKASGEVAPGVDVRLTVRGPSPYTFFALDTVTAADGTFRVSGASPGGDIHWELFRNGTAFQFGPWQAVPETPGELRLEPIVIEETATVHGRVLDPVGVPITWGYLKVRRPEDQGVPARSMAFLDPRGRFLLRDVPEGRVELWVTIQGGWPTQLLKLEVNADMEFDVQLERGFEIGGRVVDPQGRPLAGRWLGLEQQNPITKTDDEGRFLLRGLGPGPHSIYIGDAGLPAAEGIRGNTFDVEIIED